MPRARYGMLELVFRNSNGIGPLSATEVFPIKRMEERCPDCQGGGFVDYQEVRNWDSGNSYLERAQLCERCDGTGTVARWVNGHVQ